MNTLVQWLGEGGLAVPVAQAEARARVCYYCRKNRKWHWWEWLLKLPVAWAIRKTLRLKNRMRMHVPVESNLHMCDVCGCCIRLKIHVPLNLILSNTTPAELADFESVGCWIHRERKKP